MADSGVNVNITSIFVVLTSTCYFLLTELYSPYYERPYVPRCYKVRTYCFQFNVISYLFAGYITCALYCLRVVSKVVPTAIYTLIRYKALCKIRFKFYHMTLLLFSGLRHVINFFMTTRYITRSAGTSYDVMATSATSMQIFTEINTLLRRY